MKIRTLLYFLILHTILVPASFSQIRIKQLPEGTNNNISTEFLNPSELRPVFALNDDWKMYPPDEPENKVTVSVPNYFEGVDEMIYEYEFNLSEEQIEHSDVQLHFLGVNYFSDVYVNGQRVYRSNNGMIPFSIILPREILKFTAPNIISVNVKYQLSPDETFPPSNTFLAPKLAGGIVREVYLQFIPRLRFENVHVENNLSQNFSFADLFISGSVYNNGSIVDSVGDNSLSLNLSVTDPSGAIVARQNDQPLENVSILISQFSKQLSISEPSLWSPEVSNCYSLNIELVRNSVIIDKFKKSLQFYSFSTVNERLQLNNFVYTLYGFIYRDWLGDTGILYNSNSAEKLIKIAKDLGLNAIRFSDVPPHPSFIEECAKSGIICFVDVPLNSPAKIANDLESSMEGLANYINALTSFYADFDAIAALGIGGSFTGKNGEAELIEYISTTLGENNEKLIYGSFTGIPGIKSESLDLSGIELYAADPAQYEARISDFSAQDGSSILFFSDVVYPANEGNSSGYSNKFTFEAQAKYLNDVLDYVRNNKMPGLFLCSLLDMQSEYNSLFNGYNPDNVLVSGITRDLNSTNRLAYKVLKSKINKTEKVAIPVGRRESDFPMFFIIIALVLSISMTLVINSKRKFREDTSRALLRPYNFFADIRDQRILTDLHTNFLMVIIAGTYSLLATNLLYFFRQNILLEKILVAFGNYSLINTVSYLAYHPVQAFLWLMLDGIVFIFLTVGFIKLGSAFVKNRVNFISVYSTVTWAFLPIVLLLPVLLVLYRVLSADAVNFYIYISLGLFILWMAQRVAKGIFVIFDVRPAFVYISAVLVIAGLFALTMLFFELSESSVSAITNSFKQYSMIRPEL